MKLKLYYITTILVAMLSLSTLAQKGVTIAYVDTQYILENIPEYKAANAQLNTKAEKWKAEIEAQLNAIKQQREALNQEKPLLTEELYKERQEDINFEEKLILEYQQQRFGPNGDLFTQRKQLMQPIQDQIFNAVHDIANSRNYDFVFDKSADVVMLYSAKRYDISEQVLRGIQRANNRTEAQTREERRTANDVEVIPEEINEAVETREQAAQNREKARETAAEERRQQIIKEREAKRKEAEERRQQLIEERKKAIEERKKARNALADSTTVTNTGKDVEKATKKNDTLKTERQKALEERKRILEERREARRKAVEARKKEAEERARKAKEERERKKDNNSKTKENNNSNN